MLSKALFKNSINFNLRKSPIIQKAFVSNGLLIKNLQDEDPEMFHILEQEKKRQRESIVLIASENLRKSPIIQKAFVSNGLLIKNLQDEDPEMFHILEQEKKRQRESIVLIASENFTSKAVMQTLGSVMQNKYSEGYPGQRYYAGNEWIDKSELLCQKRALECFELDSKLWGVNVQPLSGSPANLYVYGALLKPHERIMGLDLPHVNEETGIIDYDALEKNALLYRPKIIVAGTTAYSRLVDYKRMREICDKVGAYMLADISHISGLLAANVIPSPFPYADIVSTTTHKSLRGPRGAMIFFRKGERKSTLPSKKKADKPEMYNLETPINNSVFPGHQGGPHNHTIAALSVALKQTRSQEYVEYQKKVIINAKAFGTALVDRGYKLVTGGTDNHLLLIDMATSKGVDGAKSELIMELANIIANKNTVPGDKSALIPSGIRVGTPAMTTRGFTEKDFNQVAEFMDRAAVITRDLQDKIVAQNFRSFKAEVTNNISSYSELNSLKHEVSDFCKSFPTAGFALDEMSIV
ncbi:hypothetical protein BB561_000750 [Smittium simulii]|uniref:Serine hydroxymethyltransferase n=1 Tax=Smittium simulii TaxID=133385 RepID=A0A2T9YXR0_9FUNG|nr:hypothetical protein BB561_000750 [Smittium simulii]